MKPVKVAQIGTGHDHATASWGALKKNSDCFELVGIAEPISENAGRLNDAAYKDAKIYTLDELLAMDDLEAVVIEAGKENEVRYAQMFADKGIAVHVDKPGSSDYNEYAKLINTMKVKQLPLSVGYMYRFNPLVMKALEMARSGELGEIYSVEAQMSVRHDSAKRRWLGKYKGGMLYFLGCHLIDMVCQFQGFPDEILPLSTSTGNEGIASEDFGFAVLKYKNGVSFVKTCASELNGFDRRQLVICGTKGTFEIRPWEIHTSRGQLTDAKLTLLHGGQNHWADDSEKIESEPYDRYDAMMRRFASQVRGEVGLLCDYDYELELMRTIITACGAKNAVYGMDR